LEVFQCRHAVKHRIHAQAGNPTPLELRLSHFSALSSADFRDVAIEIDVDRLLKEFFGFEGAILFSQAYSKTQQ